MQTSPLFKQATLALKQEHDVIERVLDLLERSVLRMNQGQTIPSGFASWAVEFFRTFADRCHHGKEEDCLFPLLEQRGIGRQGGPIGMMLHEHTLGRDCVRRMDEAAQHRPPDNAAFTRAAAEYATLLRQHIAKENNVLFHLADRCLSDEDDLQLMADFHQAEHAKGGHKLHERFETELKKWEKCFESAIDPDEDLEAVLASYYRCENADGFFDTFYEIFFSKSSEIPPMFAATDMEKQKQIVMASLLLVLRLNRDDPVARAEVEKLAVSHSRQGHNVRPELYKLWLDALCESVAKHDPQYTRQLEGQWRRVMQRGIDLMRSKY